MALCRVNRPGFIIYGGSMPPSYRNNERLDVVSAFESFGKYLSGEVDNNEGKL